MTRRRLVAAALLAAIALWGIPTTAAGHAIDGTFTLPVPLWLYLAGAASAVAASFAVVALAATRPSRPPARVEPPAAVSAVTRTVLRLLGLLWWYGTIAVGILVGDISPLPAVLLWVGIWIALPIAAVALGNPWPSMSPFRTTFAALDGLGSRVGLRLDAGLDYPRSVARWPAVVLLWLAIAAELFLPGTREAGTIAGIMGAYTLATLLGMLSFGSASWLRNAELFEVLLAWYGRIGPIARRSVDRTLCESCGERCDPEACIDCPECSTSALDGERSAGLRPWFTGLADMRGAGWSDAAFIVLLLAGVTYDGLGETSLGAIVLTALLPPIQAMFGPTVTTFVLVHAVALTILYAAFFAAFAIVIAVTRTLHGGRSGPEIVAGYAATLLPIAAGYLIAHYLTLVIQSVVWLPSLIADPLMGLAPDIGWIPIGLIWYLSVGAIVGGHVAGVALAHRLTVKHAPRRAIGAGVPMVLLMIGYTVLSLWIIAQPIVVEPDLAPTQARAFEARP